MNILVSPGEILWLKRHVGFASRLARVVNYTQCFDVNTGPTSSINQIQLFKSTRKGPHRIICRHLAVSVKTSKLYLPPWGKNWTNISLKDCSSTIPLGHSYSTINQFNLIRNSQFRLFILSVKNGPTATDPHASYIFTLFLSFFLPFFFPSFFFFSI